MTDMKRPETAERLAAKSMSQQLDTVINRLGAVARDLRLIQTQIDNGVTGDETYAMLAAAAQHLVAGAIPYLGIHVLTSEAADADRARTRRLAAEAIARKIDDDANELIEAAPTSGPERADDIRIGSRIVRDYAANEG